MEYLIIIITNHFTHTLNITILEEEVFKNSAKKVFFLGFLFFFALHSFRLKNCIIYFISVSIRMERKLCVYFADYVEKERRMFGRTKRGQDVCGLWTMWMVRIKRKPFAVQNPCECIENGFCCDWIIICRCQSDFEWPGKLLHSRMFLLLLFAVTSFFSFPLLHTHSADIWKWCRMWIYKIHIVFFLKTNYNANK